MVSKITSVAALLPIAVPPTVTGYLSLSVPEVILAPTFSSPAMVLPVAAMVTILPLMVVTFTCWPTRASATAKATSPVARTVLPAAEA